MKRGSPLRRGGPLRKRGARAEREAPALKIFRETALKRAKGRCELCGQKASRLEVHHLHSRARGVGWPGLHDPDINAMVLCVSDHMRVTLDPRVAGPRYLAAWASWRDWMLNP